MIKVKILRKNDLIVLIEIKGHANYDEYGKDIVCAGVSSIAVGAINNLKTDDFKITMQEGLIRIETLHEISYHDQVVLETMIVQLKTMEESYGSFLSINY